MESPARLCRPGRQASLAHPRGKPGFSTLSSGCGRETDCPLEGDGFELSVPRQRRDPWRRARHGARATFCGAAARIRRPAANASDDAVPTLKTEDLIALWNEGEGTLHVDQPAVPGNSSRRGQSAPSICAVAYRIDSRLFRRLPPSTSSRPCPAGIRKLLTTADLRPTPPLDGLQPSVPETVGDTTLTCRQAVTALSFCSAPNGRGYHP